MRETVPSGKMPPVKAKSLGDVLPSRADSMARHRTPPALGPCPAAGSSFDVLNEQYRGDAELPKKLYRAGRNEYYNN